MVNWLTQASADLHHLAKDALPDGLLDAWEEIKYAALKSEKRRREWLLGRLTAKLLLQAVVWQETGAYLPLDALVIANDASGAPQASCQFQHGSLPVTLSISHSGERAFCAAFGLMASGCIPAGVLGADIEQVEGRAQGFASEYFTETEQALIGKAPLPTRDLLVTATWSAKESALKALRLGLSVDTRSVTCLIEPVTDPPGAWTPFDIQWDVRRLNRCSSRAGQVIQNPPQLIGWWRIMDGYVLTLAAESGAGSRLTEPVLAPYGRW